MEVTVCVGGSPVVTASAPNSLLGAVAATNKGATMSLVRTVRLANDGLGLGTGLKTGRGSDAVASGWIVTRNAGSASYTVSGETLCECGVGGRERGRGVGRGTTRSNPSCLMLSSGPSSLSLGGLLHTWNPGGVRSIPRLSMLGVSAGLTEVPVSILTAWTSSGRGCTTVSLSNAVCVDPGRLASSSSGTSTCAVVDQSWDLAVASRRLRPEPSHWRDSVLMAGLSTTGLALPPLLG